MAYFWGILTGQVMFGLALLLIRWRQRKASSIEALADASKQKTP